MLLKKQFRRIIWPVTFQTTPVSNLIILTYTWVSRRFKIIQIAEKCVVWLLSHKNHSIGLHDILFFFLEYGKTQKIFFRNLVENISLKKGKKWC